MNRYINLILRCYRLARPYGRRRLAIVCLAIIGNGVMQVIGATSVFPFFALASNPAGFRASRVGAWLFELWPSLTDRELLVYAGILSILLLLVSNLATLASEVVRATYAQGYAHWLRLQLMERVAAQPYRYFMERNNSILFKKVCFDVTQYINCVLLPMMESLARSVTIGFLVVAIVVADYRIAIGMSALVGGFYSIVFLILRRRSRQAGERINEATRATHIVAQQFFGGIKAVMVQNASAYFLQVFEEHSLKTARAARLLPVYSNGPRYLIEPLAFSGLVALVVMLALRGQSFMMLLPMLSVIALAGYRMLPAAQILYAQLAQIAASMPYLHELESEFGSSGVVHPHIPPAKANTAIQFRRALVIEGGAFRYPGRDRHVFRDLNLVVPRNSSLGIKGETGSGKSTLVDVILGLHSLTEGRILVDNVPIGSENIAAWRAIIGYVPQEIFLLDDSVAGNIAFGIDPAERCPARLREAAGAAQILDFVEKELPQKFATVVGERGVRLSGGQRQRIGLARALYHRPEVLILDEATSALDSATESAVVEAIRSLHGRMTIIVIAHRLSTIEHCDRVVRLELGQLVE